jgi:hypothetical protein
LSTRPGPRTRHTGKSADHSTELPTGHRLHVRSPEPGAAAKRANPVAAAQRSDQALTKAARKRTEDGVPVHSFTSLLADLATICANHIQPADDTPAFTIITSPTPLQRQAFELLAVSHRHGYT